MGKLLTSRWVHFGFLFLLLIVLVFVIKPENPVRERIQFIVFDSYLKKDPRQSNGQVSVVDIDDESLQILGQWPWPRTTLAEIIDNLGRLGAKVVAFDGVLAEPDRTSPKRFFDILPEQDRADVIEKYDRFKVDNDEILAQSMKDYGRFVSGFTHGIGEQMPAVKAGFLVKKDIKNYFVSNSFRFASTSNFIPVLEKAAAGNGSFMADPEIDNVIRRTSLVFSNGKYLYPALGLEAVRLSDKNGPFPKLILNNKFSNVSFENLFELKVGKYHIPIDDAGKIWIYFRPGTAVENYIPAYKILDEKYDDEVRGLIDGKIMFIASSAEGLKDLRSTPLGLLPGVEIHVNAVEQILENNYLIRPLTVLNAENFFVLGIGLFLILLTPLVGVYWLLFPSIMTIILAFVFSQYAFLNLGVLIDPVYPSLSIFIIFVVSVFLTYIRTEAERKQVRQAFGLYISPHFMAELTKHPDRLKLGGETRELTTMFTDIRSFTSISEGLEPEELIRLMNNFLTPMSDAVMETRGTIDKYMGDAMMAFWNAPLDDKDHARHACQAALKMGGALAAVNAGLREKAAELGREPIMLQAGIGINTGQASVGNMGSQQRFAYSALGDSVNLASRLEGQTKAYGVDIMLGEDTAVLVPDMAILELDQIRVKGKDKPVRIYVLAGDEVHAQTEVFRTWRAAHEAMLTAYRAQDWKTAADRITACRAQAGDTMSGYYDLIESRMKAFKKNPPGADWDGVFTATSK
ncbi:MAG: adenylate/guanylate cyclase domain-containing protein [Rhodospirillales bacterium]|nr:adenylate/guanylate cyclase domain-containing protein [Rhodospirillales bacterium]